MIAMLVPEACARDGTDVVVLTALFCAAVVPVDDDRRRPLRSSPRVALLHGRKTHPSIQLGGRHDSDPPDVMAGSWACLDSSPTTQTGGRHDSDGPYVM